MLNLATIIIRLQLVSIPLDMESSPTLNFFKMARVTSGGSFYSVKDNSQVASAFGDAIGGLMSVVAQNVTMTISGAAIEGSELVAVHHDKQTEICAGTIQVNLGDMYAEETRDVLFEVTLVPPKSALDDTLVLHSIVELSYFDTLKHAFGGPLTGTAFIARPNSSELSWPNKYVAIQWLRVRTAKALYDADQEAKNGNVDKAERTLEAWLKEFRRENFEIGSTEPLLDQLLVDLTESLDLLTKTEYNPYSFSTLGVRMQAHFSQRCSEPITGKTSVYRTAQKSLRAQAFNNKI